MSMTRRSLTPLCTRTRSDAPALCCESRRSSTVASRRPITSATAAASATLASDILICEQEGDRITHDIIRRLNELFVTPIDREDIYALASALDDVVDYTEEVADYLGLYKIEASFEQAERLAHILLLACRQLAEAMPRLRNFDDISHFTVEINRLENDGDRISREAMAALFDDGIDPMVVIRWKDIYERLEAAIDATEKVANRIEGIVIKNA